MTTLTPIIRPATKAIASGGIYDAPWQSIVSSRTNDLYNLLAYESSFPAGLGNLICYYEKGFNSLLETKLHHDYPHSRN